MKFPFPPKILFLPACLILTACGGGASEEATDNVYRGVFVSTNDCADDRNLGFDTCTQAINTAIKSHTDTSPSYPSLRACAATEGSDQCERDMNHKYRPRLVAYLIEATEPPTGTPLYAPAAKQPGFRDAKNKLYLSTNLNLAFSKRASAAYAPFLKRKKRRKAF